MPDIAVLLSYTLACVLIIVVPGPTVTVIVANALKHGARAGLLNVVGTQFGLVTMIGILALGMSAFVAEMGIVFEVLRFAGAAYLIWLGIRMWRADGTLGRVETRRPKGSFMLQGFVVIWSNPKALLFFGAFIPQFMDPATGSVAHQTVLLGAIFMVVATTFDALYALAAGGAGRWLSHERVRLTERISGTFLIGGGLWLALARR